jgi:hypothetical protein
MTQNKIMVLGFKTSINGKPTGFAEKILNGTKIHSIRAGNRWKPGMLIHLATGVRTKNYKMITDAPLTCISVQNVHIDYYMLEIYVDGKLIIWNPLRLKFCRNDGFDNIEDFFNAFKSVHPGMCFNGQIIHWTDFTY